MRRGKKGRKSTRLRAQLAREAAHLMYHEGVKQYLDAKRLAARKLLGQSSARQLRFRPHDLPSNGEIRAALLDLARLAEGPSRTRRLFAMRMIALETMADLDAFSPRLIGSVASGHVRCGSDIDLHVFSDVEDALPRALDRLGWAHRTEQVTIWKDGQLRAFTHVYVDRAFPLELSVYPRRELRMVGRSSTDGKPIDRVSHARLRALIAADHPGLSALHACSTDMPDLEALAAASEQPPAGRYDGLMAELAGGGL